MEDPIDILKVNMPFPEEFDMKTGTLKFSIEQGRISFECQNSPKYGYMNTEYSFHPNIVCEGRGICLHCGRTMFEND